jgi:hypothetical protein
MITAVASESLYKQREILMGSVSATQVVVGSESIPMRKRRQACASLAGEVVAKFGGESCIT